MREAYATFDFKRIYFALSDFMTSDLSAFYFDIRKDRLYCDPASSKERHAALTVIDRLFDCLVRWLAPMIPFTTDEAWSERHGDGSTVHLELFADVPAAWRNEALDAKWEKVHRLRRVILGALEEVRVAKKIGSSLEAKAVLFLSDPELVAALEGVDMAEVAITSGFELQALCARTGECLSAPKREGCRGGDRAGGGAQMRPLVEIFRGGRHRSGLSRCDASRRCGASRIRRSAPGRRLAWLAARRSRASSPRSSVF